MAQQKQIQLGTMRLQVCSLASLSGLRIQHCRDTLWCQGLASDPALLWLWCRPAAVAPLQSLAWEPPYAISAALKSKEKKKKKNKKEKDTFNQLIILEHLDIHMQKMNFDLYLQMIHTNKCTCYY